MDQQQWKNGMREAGTRAYRSGERQKVEVRRTPGERVRLVIKSTGRPVR